MKHPLYFCTVALLISAFPVLAKEPDSTPIPKKTPAEAEVKPIDFEGQLPMAPSHAEALVRAAKEKRLVLTLFASSTCPYCKAFREGVLITPEFRAFAKEKLVLVVFDLAQLGAMTRAEQTTVDVLRDRYKVKGTPHMVLEAPSEKVLLDTEGYQRSEAARMLAEFTKFWEDTFKS